MKDRYFEHIVGCLEASIKAAEDGVDCHIPVVTVQNAVDLLKEQEIKGQISDAIHETAKQFRQTIVRCKDCKHGEKVPTFKCYPDVTWCNQHSTSHNDDWFCADGEQAIK